MFSLSFLKHNPAYGPFHERWQNNYIEMLSTAEAERPSVFQTLDERMSLEPNVHFGPIVSFAVVASNEFTRRMSLLDRNVLAVDTESAGVFEIASNFATPSITIRAVSDFADNSKNKLELDTGNLVRYLAAKNAAFYLASQLTTPTIISFLRERRAAVANGQSERLSILSHDDPLDSVLKELADEIHVQLQETCPAYRHKPKGTILPTPRVLRLSAPPTADHEDDWDLPREFPEMIEQFDRITISLEPTYPDQALPWVLADIVLRTNGTRLYVPFVINGESVSPNRFKIEALPRMQDLFSRNESRVTPVIIINDPNLQSKTRTKALVDEMNRHLHAKVVVIAKKHGAPILVESFSKQLGGETFTVADFSLGTLSNFVSSNFGIDLPQAAVLAIKINDTFEQFNMHAHPSYFAGISADVLAGIIAANRRGELIELAVDGAIDDFGGDRCLGCSCEQELAQRVPQRHRCAPICSWRKYRGNESRHFGQGNGTET